MIRKQTVFTVVLSLVALGEIAAATALGVRYRKLRPVESPATQVVEKRETEAECSGRETVPAVTNTVEAKVLRVNRVGYDGDAELSIVFNERPDMEVIRHYISAGPLREGVVGFRYAAKYNRGLGKYEPTVYVTGDFAYRTNSTLRVLKGLPLWGKGANSAVEGALENDFVHVFRRNDPEPYVKFADDGRYLPPGGRGALRIESMSVGSIVTELRRVEPRNIVQLLAREESVYSRYAWNPTADAEDTVELSGGVETNVLRCVNRLCEKETGMMSVKMHDGGNDLGVFLATVRNGDLPRNDYGWSGKRNPNRYRLVCLSDIGLSVRRYGDRVGVWAVSLTKGTPVSEAEIEVYSPANILVGTGTTDANGWCEMTRCAKGEPFAVVAVDPVGRDMTFLALRDSMAVDETCPDGARSRYLRANEIAAFLWTERGIYRHGERIFAHAIVRNGGMQAPKPMPLSVVLRSPRGNIFASKTVMTDGNGSLVWDGFVVPHEQPSGKWKLQICLPGREGGALAVREVKIEEFAPPQIRVAVEAASAHPTNFSFSVSAEHLFGEPAGMLACEGAVVFEDVPFAPGKWKGFRFGNDELGLSPCFRELHRLTLDDSGKCEFVAPMLQDCGRPKAAVRATGQGVVFEDGGRPATARKSLVLHYYPYYLGSNLPAWLKLPKAEAPKLDFVCVDHGGEALGGVKRLSVSIERVDSVYSYRKNAEGWSTWNCERIRSTVVDGDELLTDAEGRAVYTLPLKECGDYVLSVRDPETGVSFGRSFYLSSWGDDVIRAPLSDPTEVAIQADRPYYRIGEVPRLVVKAPFAGHAMLSVMHEGCVYTEILKLTNATSEVVLRPVERSWAPNVDVALSVVQSVQASAKHLAVRAHGRTTLRVKPAENELSVGLKTRVDAGARKVFVEVEAPEAVAAVVTLVDEGINLLTGEAVPDPIGYFAMPRTGDHRLYDLYHRVLPVVEDGLKVSGVKTGGGFGAEMLGRVSPVPTRRFRPLSQWKSKVDIVGGKGSAVFELPEFVGEVRVTALAYSGVATGAAAVQCKVVPKLVMQPDAPRFVAPGDVFEVSLPLRNRGDSDGEVKYSVSGVTEGGVFLRKGGSTNVLASVRAASHPGEMSLVFRADGLGESHSETIPLPVRPAVPWRMTCGVAADEAEARRKAMPSADDRFETRRWQTPLGELASALEWLAEYPHGCLEQTTSRIFPLVTGGGILNAVNSGRGDVRDPSVYVAAGVRRVESMIREKDFVMWPDCTYAPWDREVSLYAAHFLIEAELAGQKLAPSTKSRVLKFLRRWAMESDDAVSAYACHTLALAGVPERDRMFRLFDRRESLGSLARARLARAFAAVHDAKRAGALMKFAYEPQSVREASFTLLALLELDPQDGRIPRIVQYLAECRDRERFCWGTTGENAHALMAIGAYYRQHPGKLREPFVMWRRLSLPRVDEVKDESSGISISRRYLKSNGSVADMGNLVRGELLVAELTVTSDVSRVLNDLVIEDLFPAAFEPVHSRVPELPVFGASNPAVSDWVMRRDARDDRMLVFSKKFKLEKNHEAKVFYPVRVVSAGDFVLPGPSVEGMYNPQLRSCRAPGRVVVRH